MHQQQSEQDARARLRHHEHRHARQSSLRIALLAHRREQQHEVAVHRPPPRHGHGREQHDQRQGELAQDHPRRRRGWPHRAAADPRPRQDQQRQDARDHESVPQELHRIEGAVAS